MKTVLIAAITADGYIGRSAEHLADWTGKADKRLFVQVTKHAGTMVMGARTFETLGRSLPGRRTIVYTNHPEKITAEDVKTTNEPPAELVARLKKEGASGLAICGGASIYTLFMKAGVVDELYLTVAPILFGTGIRLFTEELEAKMTLLESRNLDENTALLHYAVVRHRN